MNKLIKTAIAATCCAGMSTAMATTAEFEDYARVVNTVPQTEQYNQPRQECRTEYREVQRHPQRSVGGAIIGGLAGGAIGNQVGGGSGRHVATAAGAIAGAIIGDRIDNSDSVPYSAEEPIRQCHTVDNWQTRTIGYQVMYEYRGRTYTTHMPYHPGNRIKLHVALTPH